jgi:uncharacterized repeat protein (TIGR01451 family)
MKLILETRHLFDGSVAAVAHKVIHSDAIHHNHHGNSDSAHHSHSGHNHAHQEAHPDLHRSTLIGATHAPGDIPALASNPHATEILFVDPRVANWQTLAKGAAKDVQVIVIDPARDGLAQVTAALKGRSDLTAIHFLTYGQSGQLELGSSPVTTAALTSHAAQVASWGDHLATGGNIEFWGCDVGQGASGQAFVDSVHALTGAQVGASTDATGAAQLGGNWTLERTTGVLAVGAPFSAASIAAFQGVLDTPLPTVTFDPATVPGDVLLGSTFTETVSFTNNATAAVGYGPFIELFVPNDPAQTASLTSASFLGTNVAFTKVAISNVAGHGLGALSPLGVDGNGNPLFIAAPAGYQAGDWMVTMALPFGSFTPHQPAADIQLTFTVDNSTELSSMHGGQPLNITAIGGFQYGADPLNDPATDPSLVGTSVRTSSTVSLLDVSATTDLHEGETATGPDYPFNYVVTINPAPVTASDPVHGVDFTFKLPDQVQFVPGANTINITGPAGEAGVATLHPGANGVGGTVTVHFDTLTTDAGNTPTTIKIPVFVPQFDVNGVSVLGTDGAPRTVDTTAIYSYTGSWQATAASLDHGNGLQTIAGDSSSNTESTSFVAKALAIQVTDNATGNTIVPGEPITYSIHFEVSDYYSLNNLKIADLVGDGVTLLAPGDAGYTTPTLSVTSGGVTQSLSFGDVANNAAATINTETVAASGSNAVWNYARDDASSGATTVNFNVGMLIGLMEGGALGSVLQGGAVNGAGGPTQGVISFAAKVLDKYTNANSGASVREKDAVTDTVMTTGTSATVVTVDNASQTITNPNVGSVTDDSAVTDTVAPGSMVLSVIAVNGDTTNTTNIEPGDVVTYGLTYSLTTGDYGNLSLSAYLPEPVFSTTDPHANGSTASTFTQDTSADAVPAVGTYKVIDPLSGETTTPTVTLDGTTNSIAFNFGDRNDPTNATNQKVQVQFSVVASNQPFADGLALTSQGTSTYTNAAGATLATAAIKQTPLSEPVVTVKTGVVSVVGDGSAVKGTYTPDTSNPNATTPWTAQTGNPNTQFAPAGAVVGNPFGTGDPRSSDDQNVSGADGGDTVRVVSTVANEGHASAFDVTVQGALPPGLSTADVTNFAIYDASGNQLPGVTAAQYFSAGGGKVSGSIAAGQAIYVVYDLHLPTTQETGDTLTVGSQVVNWASVDGGVAAGNGFVSGTDAAAQPVGESAAALSDNATIGVTAPSIVKTVTSGSDGQLPLGTDNAVVPGETVTYTITVTLPQGVTSNGAGDVTITDPLPPGMTFQNLTGFTFSNGVTSTTGTVTASVSGSTITFDLGNTVTSSALDTPGTVTFTYDALVNSTDTAHATPPTTYANTATLHYDAGLSTQASATVTEHDPSVTENITVADTTTGTPIAANGTVFSNEGLTYTVTLTNNNSSTAATANDLANLLNLPAGVVYDPGSLHYVSGGTGGTVSDANGNALSVGLASLAPGETATFTFTAKVAPDQPAGSTITVQTPADGSSGTYFSMPGVDQGHQYTDNATDAVKIAQITPVLSISGESNNTDLTNTPTQNNTQTTTEATVGEVVTLHGVVQVPEGSNPGTVTFTLPPGMEYLPGSVTFALVSPDGDFVSGNSAISALPQFQDSNPAGANYISPSGVTNTPGDVATFHPGNALPVNAVVNSNGTITIDFGTLSNNDGSALSNFVVVEFNAVVANTGASTHGATDQVTMTAGGTSSNTVSVAVDEPTLTITKTATAVDTVDNTITYSVTVQNTGNSTAYNVGIDDLAVANESNVAFGTASGAGVGGVNSTTNTDLHYTLASLGVNGTETLTYTVKVAPGTTVMNDTAAATWQSLAGPQTFNGSTTGAAGTDTGPRDFDPVVNPAVNAYRVTAATDVGTAHGQIWQDLGNDITTFSQTGGSNDTPLAGVEVTASITQPDGSVIHETTTTAADGSYDFGLLPDGNVVVTLGTGVPANETLVYDPHGSAAASPPSASFASDGNATNDVDFSFQAPDTAPVITNWSGSVNYTEGGAPVTLSHLGATVADTQLDSLGGDYSNTTLTIQRYNNGTPAGVTTDIFSGTGPLSLAGGNVVFNGATVGTFSTAGGAISITFGAGATKATVGNVLDNLAFSSTDTSTVSTGIQIGATLDDHNTVNAQGTGGTMTSVPVFVTVNEIPAVDGVHSTFTEPNNTDNAAAAAAAAVAVDPTLSVTSNDTFTSATVQITNYVAGEDKLAVNGTLPPGLSATFDPATGTMTLTGTTPGNTLSAADVQAALRTVIYYNASDTPTTTTREITISVLDHTTGGTTTAAAAAMDIVAANDSPVLNGVPVTLAGTPEDAGSPAGAVGTPISALTSNGNVDDADGAGAHDGATPGLPGVAITAADTTQGSWWYTTDNGATWTEFAGNGLPAVSPANALHLASDANTRIYFDPNPNWNGTVPTALTFRAWDQFDGAANGSMVALPGGLGTGINTAGSAYSATSESIDLAVGAVNDAPIASGASTLLTTPEDTANPPGDTVAHLFGGNFSDTADQQQTGGNPGGSISNALAGVAITGNAADPSQGAWQYSTDNRAHWSTIPTTGLSDSNALVLSSSADVRFVPAANFNGVPGQLTTHLIDSSTTAVSGATTGADLAASDTAIAGVDVSATHNGGTTAISTGTVDLGTVVSSINDAPLAGGTATLATPEDSANPPGDTVGHLFGGDFNDSADQQQGTGNPTGSLSNPLAGVAITGNSADPSQGAWQYSTDNGAHWNAIPTAGLSDSNALVLSSSADVRFVPAPNYNGVPGQLTTHLIDGSTAIVSGTTTGADLAATDTAIAGVDVSGAHNGGITAVSTGTVALDTPVTPVNDAPLASGSATLAPAGEDSNPPGDTVANLFGGNFNDSTDQQHSPTDPNGSNANTLAGIAITGNAAGPSQGAWQYSTDNGAHWTTIPATGLNDSNALVLSSSADVRFVPAPNYNGVPGQLTTHLIDSSTSVVSGTTTGADLAASDTAIAGVDVTAAHSGGTTALSTATVDLGTTVPAINDAPVASGAATLAPAGEDSNPPGDTVANLFGGNFTDTADQQHSATDPSGSSANTLAGVAITGNGADPSQGAWQYSTDNGAHWSTIPATGLSDSNALVLSSSAQVRFVPAPDFNGVPGQLTTRLIDSSATPVSGATTGADLPATDTAITGVDVSHNGGTSAISATTVVLDTTVTAVNDAPVASGSATLPATNSAQHNPPGSDVSDLFGGNYSDSADQQHSAANPAGSTANPLAGIAITGNGADPSQGTWQYSSDGGKSWTSVPAAGLGDKSAIVLAASDSLRFVPSGSFTGTPGSLTVRLIDGSNGSVTDATGVNLGAVGGVTRVSDATVTLSTQVIAANRPIFTVPQQLIPGFNVPAGYDPFADPNAVNPPFPDDFTEGTAQGRAHRPDLYGEPIIPQVWLTGSVGNRFVIEEQHAVIQVPWNLFNDTYPNATLEYEARAPGGGPLPQWLEFDARNLTFTGTPPLYSHGTVDVEIVARDQFGNQANATFQITVGRENRDLDKLLQRVSLETPKAHPARAHQSSHHVPRHATHHAPQHSHKHAGLHQPTAAADPHDLALRHSVSADFSAALPVQPGRSAFSAQLRDAGPTGKILQARQIVQTVAEATPVEQR